MKSSEHLFTDAERVDWMAEHLTGFIVHANGLRATVSWIDEEGYHNQTDGAVEQEGVAALFRLAIDEAMRRL